MSATSTVPALIPAAGRGTRLRPVTRYLSKPMLPVGNAPIIDFSLKEAAAAGCDPLVVIGSPEDHELRAYLQQIEVDAEIIWREQPVPRGLADALYRGYKQLNRPPCCALIIPDNIILNGSGIGSLLDLNESERLVFGIYRVSREEARYFGNSGRFQGNFPASPSIEAPVEITELQEKGEGRFVNAASEWPCWRTVARSLLPGNFFEIAAEMSPDSQTGELDDVPIFRRLIASQPALGVPLTGQVYDTGTSASYIRFVHDYFELVCCSSP